MGMGVGVDIGVSVKVGVGVTALVGVAAAPTVGVESTWGVVCFMLQAVIRKRNPIRKSFFM